MPQTSNASYDALDASPSKQPDMIVAIAGHPALFSVASSTYTLEGGSHSLSSTNGFSSIYAWAKAPDITASKIKGAFPEGGVQDLGNCDIEIADKHGTSTITRDLTELVSRQAFLEDNVTGIETTLSDNPLPKGTTTINVASTSGMVAGGTIWISQEAIKIGTVASGTQLTGCTRGYLLTNDQRHEIGVKVYGYIPNIEGRSVFVFKGYQGLPLSSWLRAWGGTIIEAFRSEPGMVKLRAKPTAWNMWGGTAKGSARPPMPKAGRNQAHSPISGVRRIVRLGELAADEAEPMSANGYPADGTPFDGDFQIGLRLGGTIASATTLASRLADGHHCLKFNDAWYGITSQDGAVTSPGSGGPLAVFFVTKIGTDGDVTDSGSVTLGWSNATFTDSAPPTGTDPIDLILQLLTSTGTGTNGAYDVFRKGVGLGIPVEQFDIPSFTGVQAEFDYDELRVLFIFQESADAKEFIEEQLCKPFGWYLATDNNGKIKLVRPKNPEKLYFSKANNHFSFTYSNSPNSPRDFRLPSGVYTPVEAASALQAGFRSQSGDATIVVNWHPGPNGYVFEITGAFAWTFTSTDSWKTLGFTANRVADGNPISDAQVAKFVDSSTFGVQTITKDDVIYGTIQGGTGDRIGRISVSCNYDWASEEFRAFNLYTDAEIENLSPFGELAAYEIEAKGLFKAYSAVGSRLNSPGMVTLPPVAHPDRCYGTAVDVSSSFGIDAADSFMGLFCQHMFDRYRNPPMRLKGKVKWRFNTLEVGDEVILTHDADGAFLDAENASATLTTRVFEVVGVKPNLRSGEVELELLGHREGG